MARLRPGVAGAQLQAALDVSFARGAETFMKEPKVLVTDGRAGPNWGRSLLSRSAVLATGRRLFACRKIDHLQAGFEPQGGMGSRELSGNG